jgi:hypothetical protein
VANQEIHSVFFPLPKTLNSQQSLQSALLNSVIHFRRWNLFVEMQDSVFQLSEFMLGYVFFLGLRRRSCRATEPRKCKSWCVSFRGVLVMNLSSQCRWLSFRYSVDEKVLFTFNSVVIWKICLFDRRGEILNF